jgi:hypothetical protein
MFKSDCYLTRSASGENYFDLTQKSQLINNKHNVLIGSYFAVLFVSLKRWYLFCKDINIVNYRWRLSEVESEDYSYLNLIQDLEIESVKITMIKLD